MKDHGTLQPPRSLTHPSPHTGFSAPYTRLHAHGVLPAVTRVQLVGAPDAAQCRQLSGQLARPCAGDASGGCNLQVRWGGGGVGSGNWVPELSGQLGKSVRATQMGAASCCEVEGGDKCA